MSTAAPALSSCSPRSSRRPRSTLLGDEVEVRYVDGTDRPRCSRRSPRPTRCWCGRPPRSTPRCWRPPPELKIVARAGVGLDNVDVDAATARGVLVVNAPTSNIHSAAEHAVALLLSAARQIPAADATLREHGRGSASSFSGIEIFGKTVGVVGLGRIGQLVAQRLAAFGVALVAYDPYVSPARAAQLGIELLHARRAARPRRHHLGAPAQDPGDRGPDRQGRAGARPSRA